MMDRKLKSRLQTVLTANDTASRLKTPRTPESGDTSTSTDDETVNVEDYYGFNPLDENNNLKDWGDNTTFDAGDFEVQNTKIFGLPHQFLDTADFRIDGKNNFGYCFAKEIFMEKPMVTLIPGKPNYLPDYSKADKTTFGNLLNSDNFSDNSEAQGLLKDLINGNEESRYYDFTSDYSTYIKYVNLMCRTAAIFLGIGDETGPDEKTPYKSYNWANYQSFSNYNSNNSDNSLFSNVANATSNAATTLYNDVVVGERTFVNFIVDPNSSVTENIGNTTQKSHLEGAFDSMEGLVKEATMFTSSLDSAGSITNFMTSAGEAILSLGNAVSFGLFKKLLGLAEEQVLHGSNLIYPEIWMDSEYSKTYSLKINLVSPYGSRESIYLNIFVPMFHALCLALPKQTSANSFTSPFLIRGYSQGWFAIDMGMVESIDIDKGPEQSWSVEGLPTQVVVTLTIKDFYSQLMMTKSNELSLFWTNQGLIDFLGVTCGLDLSKPNIMIKLEVLTMLLTGKVTDIVANTYLKLSEGFKNKIQSFFI